VHGSRRPVPDILKDSEKTMELEHAFQQSNYFLLFQLIFMGSLLVPSMVGRTDIYGKAVRTAASLTVSFGPVAILLYVLFEVSQLN